MKIYNWLFIFFCLITMGCENENSNSKEIIVVTNEDSHSISFIDLNTFSVIENLEVGKRPRGVKIDAKGNYLYVALSGSPKCPPWVDKEECEKNKPDKTQDGIAVINAKTRKISHILKVGSDPEQFDISKDDKLLYVANEDESKVTVVDLSLKKIIKEIDVGEEPEGVRVTHDDKWVLVTCEDEGELAIIDRSSNTLKTILKVGNRPRGIAISKNSKIAYVSNEASGSISKINLESMEVIGTIDLGKDFLPVGIVLSKEEKSLFIAGGRGQKVGELNLLSEIIQRFVQVKKRPWGITISKDYQYIISANGSSNDISIIDLETLKIKKNIPLEKGPWGCITYTIK